jgi:hypothetical protein
MKNIKECYLPKTEAVLFTDVLEQRTASIFRVKA